MSPVSQGYHYNRNAETYLLTGNALGRGMIELLAAAKPSFLSYAPLTGASFALKFTGPNTQTYQVLTTTNPLLPITGWSVLTSGIFGATPATFTDTSGTNTRQFYRIKSP